MILKSVFAFLLTILISASFAQQNKIIVTGFTEDRETGYPIRLTYLTDYVNIHDESKYYKTISTKTKEGHFKLELPGDRPIYISLKAYIGNGLIDIPEVASPGKEFYSTSEYLLEPGDSIHLYFSNNKSIQFSGRGSEKFEYRSALTQMWNRIEGPKSKSLDLARDSLFDYYDRLESTGIKILNEYKEKISPFSFLLLKSDLVGAVEYMKTLPLIYYFTSENSNASELIKKQALKRYFDRVLSFQPDFSLSDTLAYSHWYLTYLSERMSYDYYFIRGRMYPYNEKYSLYNFYEFINCWYTGVVGDKILTLWLIRNMQRGLGNDLDNAIQNFLSNNKNDFCKKMIEERYSYLKSILSQGTPAVRFSFPDTSGNVYTNYDKFYANKILILDFWFTGCTGCKIIAPYMNKVKDHFKNNQNVVFFNISIDENKEAWLKSVNGGAYGKGGIWLYTGGLGENHPFIKAYQITSYPRLILIDKSGRILSSNPPDPKEEDGKALIKMIQTSLDKM